jgi:hypothetical protein
MTEILNNEFNKIIEEIEKFMANILNIHKITDLINKNKAFLELFDIPFIDYKVFPAFDTSFMPDLELRKKFNNGIAITEAANTDGRDFEKILKALFHYSQGRPISPKSTPFCIDLTVTQREKVKFIMKNGKYLINMPIPEYGYEDYYELQNAIMVVFFRLSSYPSGSLVPIMDLIRKNDFTWLTTRGFNGWKSCLECILYCLSLVTTLPAPYYPNLGVLERKDDLSQSLLELDLIFKEKMKY